MYIKYSELDDVDRSIVEDSHQIKLYEFMMKKGDTLRNIEDESVESIKKNQYICVSLRLSNLLVKEEFLLIKSAKFKLNRLKAEHKTLGDVKFELHQNITEECWHTNFSNQKINELGLPEITKLYDTKILKEDEMIEFEITDMVKEAYLNNNNLISFILKNDYLGLDNEQFIVSHTLNPKFEFIMDSSELGINTNDEMQMNYSDDIKIYMNLASGNKMIEHHLFKGIKDEINYDFRVYYNDNLLLKSYTYTTNYSYLIYNHVDNLYYEILTPNLISLKYYKLTAKVYNTLSKETKEIAGNYDEYLYYCFKNNCLARITEEEKKFYLSKKVQILFSELGYAHTLKIDEQNCYQIEHNLSGQLTELKLNNNLIIQLNHNTYMCFNTLEEAVFLENGSTLEIIKRKYIDQASGYRVLQNYDLTIEESIIERSALDPDLWSAYVRRFISIKNKITDIQENYSFSEVNYKKITEIKTIYTINNYLKNLLFFHYSKNKTKVTNHKNESAQYFYDSDGIVFQKVDSYNQIVSYEYIKDEKRSKTLYTKTPSYEISSENFIKNGDFSEVSSLTDIHFGWYLDNTSLSMSSLSSQVDGQKNFEANITDSQNFFMEQSIILQEGKYDLKFIYKLIKKDSIDPRVKLIVKKVYFTSGNMPNEAFIENDYLESSASWKEKKVSSINISQYEAENNATIIVQITSNQNSSKLCLKNIVLTKRGVVHRKNFIKNSNFTHESSGKPIYFETIECSSEDQIKREENIDYQKIFGSNVLEIKGLETTTKIVRQTILKEIKMKDEYTISNWLKWNFVKGDNLTLEASFYKAEQFQEKLSLKYRENIDDYQFLSKTFYSKNGSDKIIIEIKYQGKGIIQIGELRLSKALVTSEYREYNGKNHLKKRISNENTTEYTYDYELQTNGKEYVKKITDENQVIEYNYDLENRLIEQKRNHAHKQVIEYDPQTKKICQIQTLVKNTKRKRTYVDSSFYRETQEDGYYETCMKDLYGEISQIINPKGLIKTMPKGASGKVEKVSFNQIEKRKEHEIQYDEKLRIKTVIGDGNTYTYHYNDQNDIVEIKLGLEPLLQNQYSTTVQNIQGTNYSIYDSKLVKQIYSNNSLTYDYIYNDMDQVESIKMNNVIQYKYEYNGNFLLSKKKFFRTPSQIEETVYTYDENNQLIKEESLDLKIYLNKEKNKKSYQIKNTCLNQEYLFQNEDDYRIINEMENLKGNDYLDKYEEGHMAFGSKCLYKQYTMKKDLQIKNKFPNFHKKSDHLFINLTEMNKNRENYSIWQKKLKETSSIYLWIKPEGIFEERYLFGLFDDWTLNCIHELKCTVEGKIKFNQVELDSKIKLDDWNLIAVQIDHKQSKYKVILNEEIKEFTFLNTPLTYDYLTIGKSFFDDYTPTAIAGMNFLLGNVIISNEYNSQQEIELMYAQKKHFEKSIKSSEKIESVYKGESDCEIITFRNSLISNKGRKPYKYNIKGEEEKIYFEEGIKVYDTMHNLGNATLVNACYDFNIPKTGGECCFELMADSRIDRKNITTLFSLGRINIHINETKLYLYYMENMEMKQDYIGEVSFGSSTKIGLTFKNNKLAVFYNFNRVLNMDWETAYFEQKEIIIGDNYGRNFGGIIKNFIYGETLGMLNYIQNVNNLEVNSCQKVFDSFNRIEKKIIDDKEELYMYEKNGEYDLNRIHKVKQINETEIQYEYDENRNIKKVTSNRETDLNYEYTYDGFDQLIEEKWSDGRRIYYTYDLNGNITYKCLEKNSAPIKGYQYSYQNGVLKTLSLLHLMENRDIQYNAFGEVTKIGGEQLFWQEKKLVRYNNFIYEYNQEGIRNKKIVEGVTTKIYLDETKVIAEEKNEMMTYYLYDESNLLYGFEYERSKYYYVRNLMGNIQEIIDSNGNSVVKYNYNGYGEIIDEIVVNSNMEVVVKANSFLYKGYYYDRETKLYYLNSRYYNPEIGRFISADDISYLDPESVNGLNLYAYCGNNPRL